MINKYKLKQIFCLHKYKVLVESETYGTDFSNLHVYKIVYCPVCGKEKLKVCKTSVVRDHAVNGKGIKISSEYINKIVGGNIDAR